MCVCGGGGGGQAWFRMAATIVFPGPLHGYKSSSTTRGLKTGPATDTYYPKRRVRLLTLSSSFGCSQPAKFWTTCHLLTDLPIFGRCRRPFAIDTASKRMPDNLPGEGYKPPPSSS